MASAEWSRVAEQFKLRAISNGHTYGYVRLLRL